MTIDLDKLEALAKAATPGPYEVQTHYGEERLVDDMTDHTFSCVRQEGGSFEDDIAHFHSEDCTGIDDEANACYFAALPPEAVLALIAEVRALREDAERYRWAIAYEDNAETLLAAVMNNAPDKKAISAEIDIERAKEKS